MAKSEMPVSSEPAVQAQSRRNGLPREFLLAAAALLAVLLLSLLFTETRRDLLGTPFSSQRLIVLLPPVFFAGVLSFLSPCTLPILPAYFAFTFQANKRSVVLMTVSFFLGLATTMVLLGSTATALGALLYRYLNTLIVLGGFVIIAFGVMSLLGKGFSGWQMIDRPTTTFAGSYVYGATFALGWTSCIGPILGGVLGLLGTQGLSLLQGAMLSFVYALGLGLPLIMIAAFFSRLGTGSPVWRFLKGWGRTVKVGPWMLHLHSTSIISGVLLIIMGVLLASGRLSLISEATQGWDLASWVLDLEERLLGLFGLGR